MKDARTVLDNVRRKVPPNAKLLVVYLGEHGDLQCAQANCSQSDIKLYAESLLANAALEQMGKVG